MNCIY